ncbi:MAG: hypothetical protein IT383_23160 [Deltaproteobacteria bacterium]|nr:hypothetical protein [Deltaproteobacteria bacterium]
MVSIAFALALSAAAPAGQGSLAAPNPNERAAPLVVAQESGGKTEKPAEKGGAKKPGAGVLKGKELDFMARYFPFSVNENAAAPVKDNLFMLHLLGCLPLGGLWAPLVLYPSEGRPELGTDQLLSYLIPVAITWGAVVGIWVVVAIPSIIIPFCGLGGCVGCPIGLAGWYLSNNASMNAWDRAYKGKPIAAVPRGSSPGTAVAMAY